MVDDQKIQDLESSVDESKKEIKEEGKGKVSASEITLI